MKVTFKTGRIYDGPQVITAEVGADTITFKDPARGIGGTIDLPKLYAIQTPAELQAYVMAKYDAGKYFAR
jgi:hypothetical protein